VQRLIVILVSALGLLAVDGAVAEVFVLNSDGRVEGELLNPDQNPRETFIVRIAGGATVTLRVDQVRQILRTKPEEAEYQKIRPDYPDTVEGQWALAEWCLENRLLDNRVQHLERIIELDPDHAEARRALGYSQFDGQWMTQEEAMADRGYLRYQGRWRTRQEIEILERNREMEAAQKEWYVKINRWRDWLTTDRAQQARQNLLAIQDPLAVRALAERLTDAPQPPVRILFAEVLSKQNTSEARQALAAAAMDDPVEEVRLSCLDYLEKVEDPAVIAYFVKELKSKDNRLVNRAGIALSYVGNASAVGPLIDALVTTHKFKIVTPGSGGNMSTTFSSAGSGMSMNSKPKLIQQQLRNQAVLEALAKLTGQNFSYDQRAWQYWHSSQRRRVNLDARRD
jgi:phosphoglycolate phosphatase-like HAD superfamily hydrolase